MRHAGGRYLRSDHGRPDVCWHLAEARARARRPAGSEPDRRTASSVRRALELLDEAAEQGAVQAVVVGVQVAQARHAEYREAVHQRPQVVRHLVPTVAGPLVEDAGVDAHLDGLLGDGEGGRPDEARAR